jgi:diguanylate cyclase (GGDEF)-like protein/PAS domain S-box-containing protein
MTNEPPRPSGQPRPSDAHLPTAESLGPAAAQQIEQLARVFEAAPIGMAVWSIDGELLHANPVFGDLVGEATSELIGRRFEDFIESADAPDVRQLIEQVWLGERNAFECELRARRPDGVEQFVRAHIAPVYGSEGEPAYLISQVFDFTSSRLARDAPARLAADAPALLWLADETGALRAANRALVDFIGATASGELGPSPLLSPDHPDEQLARVRDRMQRRLPIEHTSRMRRHDGVWRWMSHRAVPVFGADGSFEGYAGSSVDITDAEEHRRQLVAANELYHSVVEAGPPVARLDRRGRIIYLNSRWDEVLDDPEAQLRGLRWLRVLDDEQRREIVERGRQSIETGESFRIRVAPVESAHLAIDPAVHVPGMRYWADLRVGPVFTVDGTHDGWVVTLTDVTAEVAAGSRADRLARVLDAGSDMLMIAERNGVISYVNNAARDVLGVDVPDGTNPPAFLMDVLEPESFEFFHEVVEPILNEVGMWRGELSFRTRNGHVIPASTVFLGHQNEFGNIESVSAVARDISDLKAAQRQLHEMATHDYLTGMPNRVLLYDRLEQALARFHRYGQPVALLYLDLDHFKPVNDAYGHHIGDRVLQKISDRIDAVIRDTDTAARIGGDEFCLLIEGIGDIELLQAVAERLIAAISEPIDIDGATAQVGASIGLVAVDESSAEADSLMALADEAMYQAKAAGRGRCVVYTPGD